MAYVWLFILFVVFSGSQWAQTQHSDPAKFPYPEKASYRIEWRLMAAGTATLQLSHGDKQNWKLQLDLASAGFVDRLYQISDSYKLTTNDRFCGVSSLLEGHEGKRRFATHMDFDNARHKLFLVENDLVKNTTAKAETDIAPCTYEVMGALSTLRALKPEPGNSLSLTLTNGRKLVEAKVEAQARETLHLNGKNYSTIKYEALVFNNVVYRRKGRLFMWITDDADRVPVQFRLQMGFPVGAITLELEKHERL
ncbi:MAG TPA: DUF3108 domain-containing protein [Bryobacteraceae bacterium]|nr:DUF3108 domain-containing protein [Bryobacteraceae bacterium]